MEHRDTRFDDRARTVVWEQSGIDTSYRTPPEPINLRFSQFLRGILDSALVSTQPTSPPIYLVVQLQTLQTRGRAEQVRLRV